MLLFSWAKPRAGIKAKDSAIIAIINDFINLRLIFILSLYAGHLSESVRYRAYWRGKKGEGGKGEKGAF